MVDCEIQIGGWAMLVFLWLSMEVMSQSLIQEQIHGLL